MAHDILTSEECEILLKYLYKNEWRIDLKRRTQHYGVRYNYTTRGLSYDVPPIKGSVVESVIERLKQYWISPSIIGNVIVNEYTKGQKIAPHIDSPKFGEVVMTLSLGSSAVMQMTSPDGETTKIDLHSGTVVILTGDARWKYKHEILPVSGTRVSVTFRSIA